MDPAAATSRHAPASRPPAVPLLEPAWFAGDAQPALPWTVVPEVVAEQDAVEPELRQLAAALMAALVEVLSGQRSAEQLERWVEPELLSLVEHLQRARSGQDLKLRSVRVQAPHTHAVEVSAHLRQGAASRAAALRISWRRGQWVATHLAIALRPGIVHQAGWINPLAR
ncbi:MAG TPA: Rv3235 family protein [Propionicimonas sp.]|nr:Rv3235 family protein [Propionicimonas sp.]